MARNYIGVDLSRQWLDIFDPRAGAARIPNCTDALQDRIGGLGLHQRHGVALTHLGEAHREVVGSILVGADARGCIVVAALHGVVAIACAEREGREEGEGGKEALLGHDGLPEAR